MSHTLTPPPQNLEWAKTRRDGFLDSWRGIFHVVLVIDHVPFVLPSTFAFLSAFFSPFGYFSAAEGFVFLSGFVSGLVYTRVGREQGRRAVWRKAIIRARNIYICYVIAVVALLALAKTIGEAPLNWGSWTGLVSQSLPTASIKVVTLLYQPTFLEILPMYCLFLLVTPAILNQLEKRKYVLVGATSILIWIAAQYGLRGELLNMLPFRIDARFGFFNSFAWQILFVFGLICGYKTYNSKVSWLPNDWKLPALAYVFAVLFMMLRHNLLGININETCVSRSTLGPVRLLNIACIIFLICWSRKWIEKYIAWNGFAFLSKHSLQVFAFHLYPLYFIGIILGTRTFVSAWTQVFIIVFGVLGLFQVAFLSHLIKNRLFNSSKRGTAVSVSPVT